MFVIIPAKPFQQAKSRLAPILSAEQRFSLSQNLLIRTISLARHVGPVVVISRDRAARQLAQRCGAWTLVENKPGLNPALSQAIIWATMQGASSVLILPADLPLLQPSDLTGLVDAMPTAARSAVICPCRRDAGTNALLLRPPALIDVAFGPHSFNRHVGLLQAAGVMPVIYQSDTLSFDLDLPEDWHRLMHHPDYASACVPTGHNIKG
jgi:2-phospho-L-lactate guanylyltransferase